jgi:glycosyltransferase involved in cell wall biosynthesis
MDAPTISVAMSVFNGEAFLHEAMESILAQTFRDFEFIIVDDGSTDKSLQILADYAKRDPRIKVFPQRNIGRAESLNRAIKLASTSLIARMDADDVALPNRLKEQFDFLKENPNVGLLSGAYEEIDNSGRVLGTIHLPLSDAQIRVSMLDHNPICHPAAMMRKEIPLACGGYRRALLDTDDYDLWLRMAERTQLANLDSFVLRYRIHPSQSSIQNVTQQIWCFLAASRAASYRARGRPDPLEHVEVITPTLLTELGVSRREIERALIKAYKHRIGLVRQTSPEAALRINSSLSRLSRFDSLDASARTEMWLRLAATRYEQGKIVKALVAAGRGVFTGSLAAGRPMKRRLMRLLTSFAPKRQT